MISVEKPCQSQYQRKFRNVGRLELETAEINISAGAARFFLKKCSNQQYHRSNGAEHGSGHFERTVVKPRNYKHQNAADGNAFKLTGKIGSRISCL